MCDLTGFVITAEVRELSAATLSEVFMAQVLLRIGFCGLIVPDAGSSFRGEFRAMGNALGITVSDAACGNHKAVSVERYFRYLNKAMTIAFEMRGTSKVSVEAAHAAGFAWNASCIDGTDIIRSVPAIGQPFRFPFDTAFQGSPCPSVEDCCTAANQKSSINDFIRLGQSQSQFATNILRILTEDRRIKYAERVNDSRRPREFLNGDIVSVCVQVTSDASKDRVAKLSYRRRGPYLVVRALGQGAYELRRLWSSPHDDSDLPVIIKHMAEAMELLPPCVRQCEPLDAADQRYLSLNHAPCINPIRPHLGIEGYNLLWFNPANAPPATHQGGVDLPAAPIDAETLAQANKPFEAATTEIHATADNPGLAACDLFDDVTNSCDKLFFIAYRHKDTL